MDFGAGQVKPLHDFRVSRYPLAEHIVSKCPSPGLRKPTDDVESSVPESASRVPPRNPVSRGQLSRQHSLRLADQVLDLGHFCLKPGRCVDCLGELDRGVLLEVERRSLNLLELPLDHVALEDSRALST